MRNLERTSDEQNPMLKSAIYSDVFWFTIGILAAALVAIGIIQAGG